MSDESPSPSKSRSPFRRFARALLPLAVIIALVWGGLAFIRTHLDSRQLDSEGEALELSVGAQLPDFHLHPIGGGSEVAFSATPGRIKLVNFWATWCEACLVEMPSIVKLRRHFKDQGFEVIGINFDENPEEALAKASKQLGVDFPNFADPDGELAELFGITALPLSVIVDANLKIITIDVGEQDWYSASSIQAISKLLGGASP